MVTTWIPTDDPDEDLVNSAILEWHAVNDMPTPNDASLAKALWVIPAGTSFSGHPDLPFCSQMRVILPEGSSYTIEVDRDADARDGSWHMQTYYRVSDAWVIR